MKIYYRHRAAGPATLGSNQPISDMLSGPERETILERLVKVFRLPYPITSLILALSSGTPLYYLGLYLDTGKTAPLTSPVDVFIDVMFVIVPLYAILGVRYMRLMIVRAEPKLAPLTADGEVAYHRAFKRVTETTPTILLAAIIFVITIFALGPYKGIWSFVTQAFSASIAALAYSSIVWMYVSSVSGLHQLGRASMKFKPFYEDSLLGTGPMGSISLSLALIYFGGILIAGVVFSSNPPLLALLLALTAVGAISFLLPLASIHSRMRDAKERELSEVRRKFGVVLKGLDNPDANSEHSALADLRNFQTHDYLERKAENIRTWPFDFQVLEKFLAIILSVIAILLSRIIQIVLRL